MSEALKSAIHTLPVSLCKLTSFQHASRTVPHATSASADTLKLRRYAEVRDTLAGRQSEPVGAPGLVDRRHDGVQPLRLQLRKQMISKSIAMLTCTHICFIRCGATESSVRVRAGGCRHLWVLVRGHGRDVSTLASIGRLLPVRSQS